MAEENPFGATFWERVAAMSVRAEALGALPELERFYSDLGAALWDDLDGGQRQYAIDLGLFDQGLDGFQLSPLTRARFDVAIHVALSYGKAPEEIRAALEKALQQTLEAADA